MTRQKSFHRAVVGVALVALLVLSLSPKVPALKQRDERTPVYVIHNVFDAETRSAIAATGALIIEVGKDYVLVEATPKEKRAIEAVGLLPTEPIGPDVTTLAFPAGDKGYHDYAEMVADIQQTASNHPDIFLLVSPA